MRSGTPCGDAEAQRRGGGGGAFHMLMMGNGQRWWVHMDSTYRLNGTRPLFAVD